MEDAKIIDLYFARNEDAICQTDAAYGKKLFTFLVPVPRLKSGKLIIRDLNDYKSACF